MLLGPADGGDDLDRGFGAGLVEGLEAGVGEIAARIGDARLEAAQVGVLGDQGAVLGVLLGARGPAQHVVLMPQACRKRRSGAGIGGESQLAGVVVGETLEAVGTRDVGAVVLTLDHWPPHRVEKDILAIVSLADRLAPVARIYAVFGRGHLNIGDVLHCPTCGIAGRVRHLLQPAAVVVLVTGGGGLRRTGAYLLGNTRNLPQRIHAGRLCRPIREGNVLWHAPIPVAQARGVVATILGGRDRSIGVVGQGLQQLGCGRGGAGAVELFRQRVAGLVVGLLEDLARVAVGDLGHLPKHPQALEVRVGRDVRARVGRAGQVAEPRRL